MKNESKRVTVSCKVYGRKWHVHASQTETRLYFKTKTLTDKHSFLHVNTNKDVTLIWVRTEFGDIIKANEEMKVDVMREMVRQKKSLKFLAYTLYKAKKFSLK